MSSSDAKTAPETSDPGTRAADQDQDAPETLSPLDRARSSLRQLLDEQRLPEEVQASLAEDFEQVERMLEKLDQDQLHIAVFGRVSVGKSALLNALLGRPHFRTSPLHGETRKADMAQLEEFQEAGLYLIDTPGINEIEGEERERLAREVAGQADLVLFVCDGDLTQTELDALTSLHNTQRPLLLVLNKVDRYTQTELQHLQSHLLERTQGIVAPGHLVLAAAQPAERIYIETNEQGEEVETRRAPPADIGILRERLLTIMASEGQTLAAINAGLAAGNLADRVGERVIEVKRDIAEKTVRAYCVTKGLMVAANPVPAADLFAALAVDITMITHLSRLYGMPMTRTEAGGLFKTIAAQLALLMGTTWGIHLLSSLLKTSSFGMSTLVTASAQGGVAYYSTYVTGRAADRYFSQGCSWGEQGPKKLVQELLDEIDRDSVLADARAEISARLRTPLGKSS